MRCHGTRWITHKRNALQTVIDRLGAYIAHLVSLAEDQSVKAVDRARLKGYLKKWEQTKRVCSICGCVEGSLTAKFNTAR